MSQLEPMTIVLPLGRWEQILEALNSSPKEVVPFVPPSDVRNSLDLFRAWRRHEGESADDIAWVQSTGLRGLPLTEKVVAAFPAFAEMDTEGFYNALHVTMGDGNLDDDNVAAAVDLAAEEGDIAAYHLALVLRDMTEDEREALYCSLDPWGEAEL